MVYIRTCSYTTNTTCIITKKLEYAFLYTQAEAEAEAEAEMNSVTLDVLPHE